MFNFVCICQVKPILCWHVKLPLACLAENSHKVDGVVEDAFDPGVSSN